MRGHRRLSSSASQTGGGTVSAASATTPYGGGGTVSAASATTPYGWHSFEARGRPHSLRRRTANHGFRRTSSRHCAEFSAAGPSGETAASKIDASYDVRADGKGTGDQSQVRLRLKDVEALRE